MKIGENKPARDVGSVQRVGSKTSTSQGSASTAQRAGDVVDVMGIPPNEFTPKVQQAIMMLMAEVEKLRRELQQTQARIADLEQLADQDPLAPIANRRAFVRELSRMLSFAERYSTPSSIVYFDVNGLKGINDTYGHAAGDAVLGQVANTLTKNVRDSDYVARLGGDEFGVILTYTDADTAKGKAELTRPDDQRAGDAVEGPDAARLGRLRRLQLQGRGGRLPRARGRRQGDVRPQAQQGDRSVLVSVHCQTACSETCRRAALLSMRPFLLLPEHSLERTRPRHPPSQPSPTRGEGAHHDAVRAFLSAKRNPLPLDGGGLGWG